MSQSMPRSPNAGDASLLAHDLKISLRVPNRQRRAAPSAKQPRVLVIGKVPIQRLAQLNAHWYESLFVALSVNAENEVVEVHILARQAKQLAYPHAGVECDEGDEVRPSLVTPDGLPVYKPADLLRVKRR